MRARGGGGSGGGGERGSGQVGLPGLRQPAVSRARAANSTDAQQARAPLLQRGFEVLLSILLIHKITELSHNLVLPDFWAKFDLVGDGTGLIFCTRSFCRRCVPEFSVVMTWSLVGWVLYAHTCRLVIVKDVRISAGSAEKQPANLDPPSAPPLLASGGLVSWDFFRFCKLCLTLTSSALCLFCGILSTPEI